MQAAPCGQRRRMLPHRPEPVPRRASRRATPHFTNFKNPSATFLGKTEIPQRALRAPTTPRAAPRLSVEGLRDARMTTGNDNRGRWPMSEIEQHRDPGIGESSTKEAQKGHEKGIVWARFFQLLEAQPPIPPALMPAKKLCFPQRCPPSSILPICVHLRPSAVPTILLRFHETNPPRAAPNRKSKLKNRKSAYRPSSRSIPCCTQSHAVSTRRRSSSRCSAGSDASSSRAARSHATADG